MRPLHVLTIASLLAACGGYTPGSDLRRRDAATGADLLTVVAEDASVGEEDASVGEEDASVAEDAAISCAPPATCSVLFTYPKGGEASVDVMGSFDGWGTGVPMQVAGGRWEARITLEHGEQVLYKFRIDGKTWVSDPANPRQTMDSYKNSILDVACPAACSDDGGTPRDMAVKRDGAAPPPDLARPDLVIPAGSCPSLPTRDFREETIYFLMTTRFFDGDASNNYYNRDRIEIGDPQWRGDFKGLIQQLDYIHDTLGFTAIWITPVVENRSGLDYHGYHGFDFTKVDPRLESPGATFQDLICAMHRRGMRLILDIVINHTSNYGLRGVVHNPRAPIKYYRKSGAFPSSDPAYPYKKHLGDYRSPNREDDDSPLAPQVFRDWDPDGAKTISCPVCGQPIPTSGFAGYQNHEPNHFFNIDAGKLDKTWYHQSGFIAGGDWENAKALQQKAIAGDCIDLNTENATVKKHIVDAYNRYLDLGVDALRVDTVKHIERGNLLEYVNAFKAHKPGLFVFGENLVKGTGWGTCLDSSDNGPADIRPWWYTRLTNDPCGGGRDDSGFSVLDFSLMSTFRDNLSQGRFGGLAAVFGRDGIYGDATKLVTFIDNHDIGPQNDWKYRFAGTDGALASALNFLWLVRGIPCLFYGTEIRFKAGAEIDGVDAPHATSGRAYFGDHLLPANIAATAGNKFVKQIKRLNQIRAASPALQKGVMEKFGENGNSFWTARSFDGGRSYAVIGVSQGGDTISVGGVKGGTYRDAVTGGQQTVGDGGTLTFSVKGSSAGVWILDGPGKVGVDGEHLR